MSKTKKLASINLGYKYNGYNCRGYKRWLISTPHHTYTIEIEVNRDGTNGTGYVYAGSADADGTELVAIPRATYYDCIRFIKDEEGIK